MVQKSSVINTSMSGPVASSMLLHIIITALVMVGNPYLKDDPVIYEQAVSVEIAQIDKITQTNRAPLEAPKPERKKTDSPKAAPPPPPKSVARKPTPPKQLPSEIPKPVAPTKPDEAPQVAALKEPKKPEPAPIPEPDPEPEPQTKQAPDPEPEKAIEDPAKSIDSLLVSLVGEEEPVKQDLEKIETQEDDAPEPAPNIPRLTDRLTISEQDALRQQLSQCWNVLAGARDAEDLVVQVRLTMNPDRTVQSAKLIDNGRYNRDGVYRAAADAALRAVRNPRCSPLRLPPDKFNQWKNITVRFDPRNMF